MIEQIYIVWLLRIIHIVGGIFWVGGSLIMSFFVAPTLHVTGEAGQKFVGHLMDNRKFSSRMAAASGSTILAGVILYWHDSAGFTSAWMQSSAARGFEIGAGFALVGFVFGMLIGRTTKAMSRLGAQMQGKPSPEQLANLQALQKRTATFSNISSIALILSVIFMAIARYM